MKSVVNLTLKKTWVIGYQIFITIADILVRHICNDFLKLKSCRLNDIFCIFSGDETNKDGLVLLIIIK